MFFGMVRTSVPISYPPPPPHHPVGTSPVRTPPLVGRSFGTKMHGRFLAQPIDGPPINGAPIHGQPINGQPINGPPIIMGRP